MAVLNLDGVVTRNLQVLSEPDELSQWLAMLPKLIGMHRVGDPVVQPYGHWPVQSPSGVVWLEESAIVAHCYPEARYMELVLHSCKAIPDHEQVAVNLIRDLGLLVRYYLYEPARNWRERVRMPYREWAWPLIIQKAAVVAEGGL